MQDAMSMSRRGGPPAGRAEQNRASAAEVSRQQDGMEFRGCPSRSSSGDTIQPGRQPPGIAKQARASTRVSSAAMADWSNGQRMSGLVGDLLRTGPRVNTPVQEDD